MTTTTTYPRIRDVKPRQGKKLLVTFDNGDRRTYDCNPLLRSEVFRPLQDEAVFRCAHADSHGYGVIWNDKIDLAESEVWLNGRIAEPEDALDKQ
ncbi:MAG: DUF2442 domain-containing protein [Kiritimatiellia bacterium]|jgi:hypothetical protein|nr:DUF2442 domain-containing protein [Kiritimatiellia bacterium]MDP6809241.1 DUF2442 domain-containing protein [Kiritimatiellia bacterium]MDP7022980.1 DUF2442 domain-containing protein [Kiritimatiellia bacterium]